MDIQLNFEQSSRLELMSIDAGKSPGQLLTEAALFLLTCDSGRSELGPIEAQGFLSEDELEARFVQILHH